MKNKKVLLSVLFALTVLSFTGYSCKGNEIIDEPPAVEYVLETETNVEINVYDEGRKIFVNSTNPDEKVRFEYDGDVISVSSDGTITPNKPGEASVKIICGDLQKTCTVKVFDTDEIPVIYLYGINGEINLLPGDEFPLIYGAKMGGKEVAGEFKFASADESAVSVSKDGVLTAKKEGGTSVTVKFSYKLWQTEYVLNVNVCKDLVVKLSENKVDLKKTETKNVEFIGVYDEGVKIEGAVVTWSSTDESVATVTDGTIIAVNYGRTYVKATYIGNGKEYTGFVLVTVSEITLAAPENFRLSGDTLVWDSVAGASKYCVYDGSEKITVTSNSLKLSEFKNSSVYFGNQVFSVYAISDLGEVKDGKASYCETRVSSVLFTDRIVSPTDTFEAKIEESDNPDFETDVPVYFAECMSDFSNREEIYGYVFRKMYFTNAAANAYGVNGKIGNWCKYSLINPVQPSVFYDSKITFWAYAEQETTFYYIKMDNMWNRETVYKQTIEPKVWTKFTCAISSNDFPYITWLAASGNFYFTDFRISELGYPTEDFSDIDKSGERIEEVINAINGLSAVTASAEYGDALRAVRTKYENLNDSNKSKISNYSVLTQKETEYGNLVYNSVKSESAFTDAENAMSDYLSSYGGVTMNNLESLEKKAKAIAAKIDGLDSRCYYGLIAGSAVYGSYDAKRKDYEIIEDTTGKVNSRIIASPYSQEGGTGFVDINGVDTIAANASLLAHPVYGYCVTMGTNPRVDTAIRFKYKNELSLDGYTHIIFAVRNPRDELMSVYLYGKNGRGRLLAGGIGKAGYHDEFTPIVLTVEEFMNYDISFAYDARPAGAANIWFTRLVAVKKLDEYSEEINELNNILSQLSASVTLSSKSSIDRARALYASLPEGQTVFVNDISVLDRAESQYAVLSTENLISSIGVVTATDECTEKVLAARASYDSLTVSEQNKVSNYATLTQAETALAAMLTPDATTLAVKDKIQTFLDGFGGATPANYISVQSKIAEIDGEIEGLTSTQRYALSNLEEYTAAKRSFFIIDDMRGTDIASRFNLGAGSNGINNGDTRPDLAAALKDATYGACATIGKNSNGLEIKYSDSAKAGLDLSGYSKVLIGLKNRLVDGLTVKTVSGRVLAENVAYDTFVTLELTVDEFLNSGIAIYVTNQGSVWLSSIIAVK